MSEPVDLDEIREKLSDSNLFGDDFSDWAERVLPRCLTVIEALREALLTEGYFTAEGKCVGCVRGERLNLGKDFHWNGHMWCHCMNASGAEAALALVKGGKDA